MLSLPRVAATVLFASATAVVHAHDTWLSGPAVVAPGATAPFDLTSSGAFPAPEHAIEVARVERSSCRVGGQDVALTVGARGKQALRLTARPTLAGVVACGLALGPRTLDLKPKDVAHYLEEIGASRTIGPKWEAMPAPRKWRETYVKHAKAFTRVGDADAPDLSAREPLGLGLEIVPLADPTRLRSGATLEVRLLKAGQPLAGLAMRASHSGRPAAFATTDEDGRASFMLDGQGPWLLAATDLRPSTARPSEWDSDFTTLYLNVAK
jgi:uncharacterized GH25 family protein